MTGTERIRLGRRATDAYFVRSGEFLKEFSKRKFPSGSAGTTDVVSMPNGRSKDRTYITDRAIPRPPVFLLFELTPVSLARDGCACASQRLGRPVGLQGPASDEHREELKGGTKKAARTVPDRP